MSNLCRRFLVILISLGAILFSVGAFADCYSDCDPYYSSCSQTCQICEVYSLDQGCLSWSDSTCGDSRGACVASGCTPYWQENRYLVGTYDGISFSHCNHHKVERVTRYDVNHCNIDSAHNQIQTCEDTIDNYKDICCWPSCCEGYGHDGQPLSCNGYHSCS